MIKKIVLTDEHIKLIKNIKFEQFDMGENFNSEFIQNAIDEIESSPDNMRKFGQLRDQLVRAKDKLALVSDLKECHAWGIDQWNLFGGTFVMEDVALILGHFNDFIPGTEDSSMGRQYPKELEDHWWELYLYIVNNMTDIFKIVLQYLDEGGLTPGEYVFDRKNYCWNKNLN